MTVEEAILTVLNDQLKLSCLRGETNQNVFAVPVPINDSRLVLVNLHPDEEEREVLIAAELCRVPPARRGAVAQRLAEFNAQIKFVVFSMDKHGVVRADVCVELAYATAYEPLIALSLVRLLTAIDRHTEVIFAAMKRTSKQPSRVEREAAEILARLET